MQVCVCERFTVREVCTQMQHMNLFYVAHIKGRCEPNWLVTTVCDPKSVQPLQQVLVSYVLSVCIVIPSYALYYCFSVNLLVLEGIH